MALASGTHLGPYEILAAIGAGGMGEVYRARDTRLDRTVAIKVLPADLAGDAERRQRFAREARAIASLTHPHICTLYEFDTEEDTDFLVMEYLEGETLARRLTRGPLPLAKTLRLAVQIADALAAAHKLGIVHRDLKPGNIMLTGAGSGTGRAGTAQVKLLDFGLAKLRAPGAGPVLASAPTASDPLTGAGTIVGTLQYMAPEQLEGRETDARTDLFAFGAIVYEMLTGRKAFEGTSQASLIAAILDHDPPPLAEREPLTPPALERTVRRCLAKDREDRWDTAHDVAEELRWIANTDASPAAPLHTPPTRLATTPRWAMLVLASVLGAIIATAALRWSSPQSSDGPASVTRLEMGVTPAEHLGPATLAGAGGYMNNLGAYRTAFAFSPAGDRLVYTAFQNERRHLFVRALEEPEGRLVPGTEGGVGPFSSPDGRSIGFWADDAIKKVSLDGPGPAITLCAWPELFGASWTRDDRIILGGPTAEDGLWQIPSAGGRPEVLTTPDRAQGEVSHRLPHLLPGGRAIVYTAVRRSNTATTTAAALVAVELASGVTYPLIDNAADARYVASGHLVFARDGALLAAPFDPERLAVTGEPVGLVSSVSHAVNVTDTSGNTLAAQFAVSRLGTLAYVPGGIAPEREARLVWVDRQGTGEPLAAPPHDYWEPRLSPDGQRVAVQIRGKGVWIYDLSRGTLTPFAPDPADWPLWTPQATHLAFSRNTPPYGVFWQPSDGSGGSRLLADHHGYPGSWTPDGQTLAYVREGVSDEIWLWHAGDGARRLMESPFNLKFPTFAPDGRWIAYTSDESGREEVYVQPYPGSGGKRQVSTEGGMEPAWAPDGRELFYRSLERSSRRALMAVEITVEPALHLARPRLLFSASFRTTTPVRGYDVSLDGRRFLIVQSVNQSPPPPPPPVTHLSVVLNWLEELKEKVPTR